MWHVSLSKSSVILPYTHCMVLKNAWAYCYSIDCSRYYYSHLAAARGRGSRLPRVRVVWTKECEVKCKYHWDIVQNKYENSMMLHVRVLCGKDLFNMGIYRLIQTKIYFTLFISMYVKPSVPVCTWLILQRPLNGHQMAVVTRDRSISIVDFCANLLSVEVIP